MTEIIDGRALFRELGEAIAKTKTVRLAVAFWGAGAVEKLGLGRDHDIEVVCNLAMGGTNPDEIERLIALGSRTHVYALDTLHAKTGVVGAFGFVGSSNVSTNGLALEGEEARSWRELNVALTSAGTLDRLNQEIDGFIEAAGAPLVPDDPRLVLARERWERRRFETMMMRDYPGEATTLLGALRERPEWFRHRRAFVVFYQKVPQEKEEEFATDESQMQQERGEEFEFYWDWASLERDGVFLDFLVGPSGGVTYTGVYERRPWMQDFKEGEYQVCRGAKRICGFPAPKGDEVAEWKGIVKEYWKSLDKEERTEGHCIPLYEVAKDWLGL